MVEPSQSYLRKRRLSIYDLPPRATPPPPGPSNSLSAYREALFASARNHLAHAHVTQYQSRMRHYHLQRCQNLKSEKQDVKVEADEEINASAKGPASAQQVRVKTEMDGKDFFIASERRGRRGIHIKETPGGDDHAVQKRNDQVAADPTLAVWKGGLEQKISEFELKLDWEDKYILKREERESTEATVGEIESPTSVGNEDDTGI
jgi:hypothetical protein